LGKPAKNDKSRKSSEVEPAFEQFKMTITDEMVAVFIEEADELLDIVESSLVDINSTGKIDNKAVSDAFRAMHSFKGNCGFIGKADLESLSHKFETVLEAFKDEKLDFCSTNVQLLLKIIDVLRHGLADVADGRTGDIDGIDSLLDSLSEVLEGGEGSDTKDKKNTGSISDKDNASDKKKAKSKKGSDTSVLRRVSRREIRVDTQKLDRLINLVGELVIAEGMVVDNSDLAGMELENFESASYYLRRITGELQEAAMSLRMVPIYSTFQKIVRLVHDLSTRTGKDINLKLYGEDTEVDKRVIEQIADPMVHIIRNSIDHGIESSDKRKAAGKSEKGAVSIEARHEGGEVWIIINDDGKGLDRDKILQQAYEKGLINSIEVNLTDREVYQFIFESGFSTASSVTDVSGRGVGMDVVRENIERLNGKIDIQSEKGRGTTFILRIPLTLAIIDGMMVSVGSHVYTIPVLSIKESFQVDKGQITTAMDGQEIIRLRENLIPVVRLHSFFKITNNKYNNLEDGIIIVVEDSGTLIAMFVDEICGQKQAVIKGLSDYLGNARGVSGCTILGDGDISLILDVGNIISIAKKEIICDT
jgi:two-component system chemotaxis sensor kinase CheA